MIDRTKPRAASPWDVLLIQPEAEALGISSNRKDGGKNRSAERRYYETNREAIRARDKARYRRRRAQEPSCA